jgi:hypothetical protein
MHMKAIISDIILFSESGEKRHLTFVNGLNIITGDSKTGKSALIEIVDFCLFSKRSTIPVGKVTDWTNIFSVVYKMGDKQLIIARPIKDLNKCYFSVEANFDTKNNLTLDYLNSLTLKDIKQAQLNFEQHVGLSVTSTRETDEQSRQTGSKATIRDAASIMFQHQNLVANKHSIFYRFDDFYKRAKAVSDFPIHLGWADGEYFALKREQERLFKELKKNKKQNFNSKIDRDKKIQKLKEPIELYFSSLGMKLEETDITLAKLTKVANDLPKVPQNAHENSDLGKQLVKIKFERKSIEQHLYDTNKLITKVGENSGDAQEYSNSMQQLLELSNIENQPAEVISCPLCHTDSLEINAIVEEVQLSRNTLIDELSKVGVFKQDNSELLSDLMKQRDGFKKEIRLLTRQINDIKKSIGIGNDDSLKASLYTLKGRIEANLDLILEEQAPKKEVKSTDDIAGRLSEVEDLIAGYDLKSKIEEANVFINKTMNTLKGKLDFEEELKQGEMKFDLATFDFYYLHKSKRIHLSEMGSGANWLACHLCLFLALLKLTVRESSSIPAVLFFDQPSQVYFPKVRRVFSSSNNKELLTDNDANKVDENIVQVVNIFSVINEFLDELVDDENISFKPQVIVLEHADEPELDQFIRERWSTKGKKLI